MTIHRTFAFVDLCGFTAYTEACGHASAAAVLADLRLTARGLAEWHGVRVTKWLGGGAMLSGARTGAVAACALAVRDEVATRLPLPLRGGIAEGPVIALEGEDYAGAAVNVAARLVRRAKPNQVLATATAAAQTDGLASLRPCPALRVHGLADPVDVRELLGVGRRTPPGAAVAPLRRTSGGRPQ